jgi:RND family efflux transporter MFP subunit
MKSFQRIYAPFSGVITQRNVDTGWLINAGNGGTSQQLFFLAQTDPIRVFVNVPEAYAPSIHSGLTAYLDLTQFPGRRFQGQVVRTAEAIGISTRMLLTEVDVPNESALLLPGGYAQVHLQIHVPGQRLRVPVNALLFRSEGLRVVVVDSNHHVHLQPLDIGRDYGTSLEVLNGLKPDDWIVLNPPDSIEADEEVHVKELKNPIETAPAEGGPGSKPSGSLKPATSPEKKT